MAVDLGSILSQLLSPQVQSAGADPNADSGAQIAKDSKNAEAADAGLPNFSVGDFVNGLLQHLGGGGKSGGQMDSYGKSLLANSTQSVANGTGTGGAQAAMSAATQARNSAGSGGGSGSANTIISTIASLFGG